MRYAHGEVTPMLIAQHFTVLLSAAAPDATEIGKGVLAILVIVPLLSLVAAVIFGIINTRNAGRRNPPVAEEMYKSFIPRAESSQTIDRLDGRISEAFSEITNLRNHTDAEINSIRANMTKAYGDFERALGRIEGALRTKKD